jgi:exodeoxyribonuclease V beta subunit
VTPLAARPFDLRTADLGRGTVLLEASAGTGKTYTLVGVLLRLLLERHIERLDQALLVTFTVAATEELKHRLRAGLQRVLQAQRAPGSETDPLFAWFATLPDAAGIVQRALASYDQVAIATIHGFCKRVLEAAAFESREPFQFEFTADPLPLLQRAAADTLRSCYDAAPSLPVAVIHGAKLTPEQLVAWYQLWQRYPHVQLEPAVLDVAGAFARLQQAVDAALATFDPGLAEPLARFRFYSDKALFDGDATAYVAKFVARVRSDPRLVLGTLCQLGTRRLGPRLLRTSPQPEHAFFTACDAVADAYEDALPQLRTALLHRMQERVERHKQTDRLLSFDDLLQRTHRALHAMSHGQALQDTLQARYRVGLIDEFQDTDPLQYDLFATVFRARTLVLVGDPKQSIYGFRGANLRTYLAARQAAKRHHTLDVNYRSSAALVHAVSLVFARPEPFADAAITMPAVRAAAAPDRLRLQDRDPAALCWRYLTADGKGGSRGAGMLPREVAEARIIADLSAELRHLLQHATADGKPLRPAAIAVLTRTNRQATAVQQALRNAGIAAVIGKAGDIFLTDELQELQTWLRAVLQPTDLAAVRGALATRWFGWSAAQLRSLDQDDDGFDRELARLDQWRRRWLRSGLVAMVEQAMAELAVVRRFLAWPGGERRLANYRQLFELLHEAEHDLRLSPDGLLEWLLRQSAQRDEIDYTRRELRLESDDDAVQILTVHGSKGLEYEVVFCPFLWDSKAPRNDEVIHADDGTHRLRFGLRKGDVDRDRAFAERLAEELRLAYVALTRARRRCYVHLGPIGTKPSGSLRSALSWLLAEQPWRAGFDAKGQATPSWAEQWAEQVDPTAWPTVLERLVQQSQGAMSLVLVPGPAPALPEPARSAAAPPAPPADWEPARRPLRLLQPRGLHSFSSLVAGAAPVELTPDTMDPPAAQPPRGTPRGVFAFARGAAAGQCLHEVLEHTDWGQLGTADATPRLRRTLAAHGLVDAGAHAGELDPVATVQQLLHDVAAAELPAVAGHGAPWRLGTLLGGARAAEWQFLLPADRGGMSDLAAVLDHHGPALAQAQAARLRSLPPHGLRGFLTGFVDLIAEHDGRHWVLDWKSNHLGDDGADYGPEALADAMVAHDYVLQYHLYLLALHRHLQQRLPGYDPARHLGGVCYVFLRGVTAGSGRGLFVDAPPSPARVAALDAWLRGEAR